MISICIPVYNFPVVGLVETLRNMAGQVSIPVEIIIIDDASNEEFQQQNTEVQHLVDQYHLLPSNIGRSRIRNQFIKYANYQYCLFLDCDVIPAKDDYLRVYADLLQESPNVIYGGRIFPKKAPSVESLLRWKYGTERECKDSSQRNADPYRNFHSNNFLIKKRILETIRFDESLTKYGYEDSLFSYHLQEHGIPVLHINNPVLNHEISKVVHLVSLYEQYKGVINLLPAGLRKYIRKRLLNGSLDTRLLQLYKLLGYRSALKR
jgi:glycosyltransferase involved in cell wall biosynthesis